MKLYNMLLIGIIVLLLSLLMYNLYIMTPYYGSSVFKVGDCIVDKNAADWELKTNIDKIVNINTYRYEYVNCKVYCTKHTTQTAYLYMYKKVPCTKELERF